MALVLAASVVTARTGLAVDVGQPAPEFTLPSTTGERISLSQFRGERLVLLEFHINDFGTT